ncbi:TonB family protein [Longimicrobium sp.]|uniref:TonB family protein n=1 Tax=Longimicrobium sp. TaxID=2029185 RepID=UPI002ED7867F
MLARILVLFLVAAASPAAAQHSTPAAADTARVYELADVQMQPSALNGDDLLAALDAAYPPHLRAAGTPGTVHVRLVIGADGVPRDVTVLSTTDTAFSAPTVAALGMLRFLPASLGDKPVAVRAVFPVNWSVAPDSPPPPPAAGAATAPADREPVAETQPELRNGGRIAQRMRELHPRGAPRQGEVWVRLQITAEGTVTDVTMIRASDPVFVQPSLQLASEMRFYPAQVEGRGAVAVWVAIPITWSR